MAEMPNNARFSIQYPRTSGDMEAELASDLNDPELALNMGRLLVTDIFDTSTISNSFQPTIVYNRTPDDRQAEQYSDQAWRQLSLH